MSLFFIAIHSIRSWKITDLTFSSLMDAFDFDIFIYCFYSSTSFIWSTLSKRNYFSTKLDRVRFFFALSSRLKVTLSTESFTLFRTVRRLVLVELTGLYIRVILVFSFARLQKDPPLEIDFAAEVKNFSVSANLFLLADKLRLNLG